MIQFYDRGPKTDLNLFQVHKFKCNGTNYSGIMFLKLISNKNIQKKMLIICLLVIS